MTTLTARLHPKWVGGRDGYHYSVICRGELIVDRSRDPECDAARALLARGITGKLTMLDGKTGRPPTIVAHVTENWASNGCDVQGPREREAINETSSFPVLWHHPFG
jgi:hypothetical protein